VEQLTHDELVSRLERRVERERATRLETERIAESTTSRLYELVSDLALFRQALELSPEAVIMTEAAGAVTFVNQAARKLFLAEADVEVAALDHGAFYPPWARDYLLSVAFPTAQTAGSWSGELAVKRHDGLEVPVSQVVVWTANGSEDGGHFTVISRDLTETKAHEAELRRLAFIDAVCGLPNRAAALAEIDRRIGESRRGTHALNAVLMFGIEGLAAISANYGHEAGSRLMVAAADRLHTVLEHDDMLARVGPCEFLVVMTRPSDRISEIGDLAERGFKTLSAPFSVLGRPILVGAVAGSARTGSPTAGGEVLLRDAETALAQARLQGSGEHRTFDPSLRMAGIARLETEQELLQAVERDEMVAHYQPIVDARSGTLQGYEALLRWDHPERGLLSPDAFIRIAEASGAIVGLGEWVLRTAVAQVRSWNEHRADGDELYISVNLSPRQFAAPGLIPALEEVLADIPAHLVQLEITDAEDNRERVVTERRIREVKALGARIAIDDFGTGYSSLTYLRELSADILKIDRGFLQDLSIGRNRALVAAMVDIAQAFDMTTVAKGVEDSEQLEQLRQLGISAAQGYLFSPPAPPETFRRDGGLDGR
jgi:diguanylate cyclase (GGDEF)-like protein/PAS domain S-box-containing protein